MGILADIRNAIAPRTSPERVPPTSSTVVTPYSGKVGKSNAQQFRNWSEHSEWLRAAINVRKTQVSSAEWDIVPFDTEREMSQPLADRVRELFSMPNSRVDSFRSFIEPIVEDILVLDAGCVEKVRNLRGEVVELWPVDGATIRVSASWDGHNPDEPRYFWYPDWQERAKFRNDELLYIMSNPRTYSPLGLSPVETLKMTIDSELSAAEYNRRQVLEAAPDGLLHLGEGARPEDVERFKSYWSSEVAGKGALAFIGGTKNPTFVRFKDSNRDMQFDEWQTYLVRKIAAVLGINPQDLGITFDINRATSDTMLQITEDRGLRPLMALIQDYFTREVVWDTAFGGKENNLAFRFLQLNLKESTARAQMNKLALAGFPWKTPNEARIDEGREPLGPEYDKLFVVTPTGAVSLDNVPSAREVLDSQNKPEPPASAGADAGPKKPAGPAPKK
jgi:phage portal protein BeeE